MIDFVIGTIILIAVVLAVRSIKNKRGICCKGCAGCPSSRDKCNIDNCNMSEALEVEVRKIRKTKDDK